MTVDSTILQQMTQELKLTKEQITQTLNLLDEGNTIPFIARYRKEMTQSLDEVQIYDIQQTYQKITQLIDRKAEVQRLIEEQDKLTPEVVDQIQQATTMQQLEDIYRPFRPKRRTKAMVAIEQGLQPLADWIMSAEAGDLKEVAEAYLTEGIETVDQALEGAHEIIAQEVSDNAVYREFIRKFTRYNGALATNLKRNAEGKDPQKVYQNYYEFSEKLNNLPSHRVLAINRAEKEDVLTVKIEVDQEPAISYMNRRFVPDGLAADKVAFIEGAVEDAYKRFIGPAIERELRNELNEKAERSAIEVFGENLRHLLLQPPLKGKVIMGFDPAYRTGCKLAVIDETGKPLTKGVIYPHAPATKARQEKAGRQLQQMLETYGVQVIAIGNGTASRESEQFVAEVLRRMKSDIQYIVISEAGASVYSASKIARDEFPDYEVEERSAVSIARRLQDPLAELIKIDPKSLGVGQYQHDVTQKDLTETLNFVVNTTVNQVGVDVNTASPQLLQHVSGLTATVAQNVIDKREELGRFENRKQIKEVKRFGPKTFEQAIGFLRILEGDNPLDQTEIHPESYQLAEAILDQAGVSLAEIGQEAAIERLNRLNAKDLAQQFDLQIETIHDILSGLKHPTADIRDGQDAPILRQDVLTLDDLEEGMKMEGVVRNVVDFGAFVDIGVSEDGLIHISRLSNKFIKHPSDVVAVGDIVTVEVLSVDKAKSRIGLARVDA